MSPGSEWINHFWSCVSNQAALSGEVKAAFFDGLLLKRDTALGRMLEERLVGLFLNQKSYQISYKNSSIMLILRRLTMFRGEVR